MNIEVMKMDDLKETIGKNIQYLRKESNMTQQDLADKLNYTPKAVSKWERGESMPEIEVLAAIASLYNVTVDFLLHEDSKIHKKDYVPSEVKDKNKMLVTALVVTIVWTIMAIVFVYTMQNNGKTLWQLFVWAIPVSFLVIAISLRQYKRIDQMIVLSLFLWTLLLAFFIQFQFEIPLIFLIGIPAELALFIWSKIIKIN